MADLVVRVRPVVGTQFQLVLFEDGTNCSGPKELLETSNQIALKATKVRANEVTTLSTFEIGGGASCGFTFSFTPMENRIYTLELDSSSRNCRAQIRDVTVRNTSIPVPTLVRSRGLTARCDPLNKGE
jgi:hypothetical protein